MTNIVANLLHLSSSVEQPSELLDRAVEQIVADSVAIVQATPPDWTLCAAHGIAAAEVPMDLAAEAFDSDGFVRKADWLAYPLGFSYCLLLRNAPSEETAKTTAEALQSGLTIVRRTAQANRRIRRLETILAITHDWHQTNDMNTLLVRMAEAATDLLAADRASIFLWDKPNKTLVGRPALGVEGGELRLPEDAGIVGQVLQTGQPRRVNSRHDASQIDRAVDEQTGYQTETILCVPLLSPDKTRLGAFEVLNRHEGSFTEEDERGLVELASYAAIALEKTQQFEQLLSQHEQLVEQTAQETLLVGNSPGILALNATVARVADTDLAILILGENGTGKEIVARSLHFGSVRRAEPFVAVNCAALTETLLESELFGHEKGAFTDAHEARQGKFELASGGTLFLDEIGDMSLAGQAKLLRVLEDKTVVRVGGSIPIHTEVRVLAATNQNLAVLVREKKFREDLYFRLNVVCLEMPPLRDRGDDILMLAEHFLQQFCRNMGRRVPKFSAEARKRLFSHPWPGNVRELRNLMERIAYLTSDDKIEADDLAFILAPSSGTATGTHANLSLVEATRQFQQTFIQQSIERARGNVSQAAKNLKIHRSNLYRKMHQLGMETEEE